MSIEKTQVELLELQLSVDRTFRQVALDKNLNFKVEFSPELPTRINTDVKRLQQVLKNLLSNAFKFTERGEVSLRVELAKQGWSRDNASLNQATSVIAFTVSDTGIGISPDKQKIIFEAFQQADGTTSRKYGGTGLGLSISREIAQLLGGEIKLVSRQGEGSTFTFFLPLEQVKVQEESPYPQAASSDLSQTTGSSPTSSFVSSQSTQSNKIVSDSQLPVFVKDDINNIQKGDCILLIVEDDTKFARILWDIAHERGFKCIIAENGSTALTLAQQFQPAAIILDISLPGIDGWTVLDRLKHDSNTRHIPVHIITVEEGQKRGLQQGAIAYLQKPVSREAINEALTKIKGFVERSVKNLLVVEDDDTQCQSIVELIGNHDVATTAVASGAEALAAIRNGQFDCVVLDLGLPDMSGFELISQLKKEANGHTLPIIIYTARELTRAEDTELRRIAQTVIIKDVRSPERLLDETALFLHRVQAALPVPQRQMLEQLQSSEEVLANKKVLIVDDDMRNIFAITSMLERYRMQVVYAENGRDGIAVLQTTPDINLVLMDVMMPEMDGYETTRQIRQQEQFKSLPIIALTAKAMQGDREKCIQAGASDYITKPVDNDQLLSLLRVWLYK
jgi:CheY-like chemotaxis protein/two-component sensor histidine kinase